MPIKKPARPIPRPRQFAPVAGDAVVRQIAQSAQRAADQLQDRAQMTASLVVGDTTINHTLGRTPTGATVTPTVANATWSWAFKSGTPTQIILTCVGVAQPNAVIEVF